MAAKAAMAAARDSLIALCTSRGVKLPPNPNIIVGTALMNTRVAGSNDIDLVRTREGSPADGRGAHTAAAAGRLRLRVHAT